MAAYRAVRGEIPLDMLCWRVSSGRSSRFPASSATDLEFVACTPTLSLEPGSFGILEPVGGEVVALAEHDAVLVPMVAFDRHCRRLGQGGGFYDRALASLPSGAGRTGPATIGVAHRFQRIDEIPCEPWDVPLDAIVTDTEVIISERGLLA